MEETKLYMVGKFKEYGLETGFEVKTRKGMHLKTSAHLANYQWASQNINRVRLKRSRNTNTMSLTVVAMPDKSIEQVDAI